MATFILIHGAWHGGWCWHKVAPLLEAGRHTVLAPDLPGHGDDKTPVGEVTLDAYVKRVCGVIDAQSEPVVLVGHSMGGIVITQTAEERPDSIKSLVYLTAFLLPDGKCSSDYADRDPDRPLTRNVVPSEDGLSTTVRSEALKDIFYQDCPDEDVALARQRLVPQAGAPRRVPMRTSDENFGRVPRVYIECSADNALPPAMQRELYTALPCSRVITMDAGHSPFFSQPEALVRHLDSLA